MIALVENLKYTKEDMSNTDAIKRLTAVNVVLLTHRDVS